MHLEDITPIIWNNEFQLPMMEKFTEKVNLNEPDRDVHSIKEASADDVESNLSVEVLARIQSALAESRRIRQLVSAEFDAERKILGSSNHFPNNQLKWVLKFLPLSR